MVSRSETTERIYGYHPVLNALRSGRAERIILADQSSLLADLQQYMNGARVVFWNKKQFNERLGEAAHQGIAADCRPLTIYGEQDLKADAQRNAKTDENYPLYMMLDGITDPHNFGACLRSAVAFGCLGVIFSKEHCAALNAACCKASAGMIEWIRLIRVPNLTRVLVNLQRDGYWALAADIHTESSLDANDYCCPLVLILGAEGSGVRAGLKKKADLRGRIPVLPPAESLNVSVAAAVCLYAIRHHQTMKGAHSAVQSVHK